MGLIMTHPVLVAQIERHLHHGPLPAQIGHCLREHDEEEPERRHVAQVLGCRGIPPRHAPLVGLLCGRPLGRCVTGLLRDDHDGEGQNLRTYSVGTVIHWVTRLSRDASGTTDSPALVSS